ncbi:MAG: hypothetical protein JGK17_32000 [Microcoleus sp. PH2017_10_PVI_O_A]|uniref:hypothetical protein n=1 Tax=unclassified Microcoleus TaxID=2642155 RepID=UPI001D903515|nr:MULTISPECIES: hypothetical protein [unclassified Microcoleus]MCC3410076.1 hypothetical protein [Microcoleus sp. PH2017_10_PVI_O_A]MCC3464336.1 hypothetical protein [Microcoleus sp. PH2017_11_PCY_U_A]MCC3482680.1 hypothetical protein [Microcoleus sp. PH2017_12_PCY_D_A]
MVKSKRGISIPSSNINLDKDTTRRPSPSEQFDAGRKDTPATPEIGMLGVSGTRELGSFGGISGVSDVAVGVQELPLPGVSIEINPAEQSAKAEVEIGVKQGFGVSFGGEVKRTPTGISVENVSFGVNVLGFGVNAKGKGNESGSLGVSAFGISVDVANDKDGKTSVRLGLSLPGISTGITLAPDGQKEEVIQQPDTPNPNNKMPSDWTPSIPFTPAYSSLKPGLYYVRTVDIGTDGRYWYHDGNGLTYYSVIPPQTGNLREPYINPPEPPTFCVNVTQANINTLQVSPGSIYTDPWKNRIICYSIARSMAPFGTINHVQEDYYRRVVITDDYLGLVPGTVYSHPYDIIGYTTYYNYINNLTTGGFKVFWDFLDWELIRKTNIELIKCGDPEKQIVSANLPNYPQTVKPMNCCDKVEEIYKYLGIAKMKKKFKVAKQFLVPGGKGNEECEDYYALNEALFRMLANGLIINPVSKPLGSEWKNVNATAWAAGVYEMVAEAMSNGDSTQKFEISTIMQQVQMMSAVAELSRKVDFISEVLGVTPDLDTEDLPVCFTIHESHKGFEKKKPKEIDVSKPKTDNEVEKVLGQMLRPSKIPIVKWVFRPDSISIAAALSKLN